ncbi:SDR family oxidoreductase [Massilia yuzhufengensis]|uniref:NAD(P)-dependent dehydrogenase, short-chain alcohol dehydrogenase family n=1 Tax=Massilia yuzhufengensis TaxID=1164594 RepID=A0A1I1D5B7_9BURK|nr:SDR family oxidoreductase [Massilia yuzhufengensis]SFB70004.1 NAD(P)-dependent dehydrogenase, short-chain alcohol dehydrogenase family [Massilia yuzhufengensis]
MPTALIIGASRGIGHEMVRQYRLDGWRVIATARKREDCDELAQLGAVSYQLDVTSADSIAALGWQLDDEQVDLAWIVAGVYGPEHASFPTGPEFDAVMHTNVLGPMRLVPIVAPLVATRHGKLAVLSSKMGSIGARSSTEGTLYRASKAALNSVLADTAITYGAQGATCVAFHPGWVQTDMGGSGATLTVEQSVTALRATLAGLDTSSNGAFLNYDGSPIPW